MRSTFLAATSLLLSTAACSPDLVRHDAGQLEPFDSGVNDAQITVDGSLVTDAGHADAGQLDADAGGTSCRLQITPDKLTFDRTEVGHTNTTQMVVTNLGPTACPVYADVEPYGAGFLATPPLDDILAAGEARTLDIVFAPTEFGFTGVLLVASSPGAVEAVAQVQGEAFLTDVAATRQVDFQVRNDAPADRYLVLEGRDCLGLYPSVPQKLSFQCGCECPPPPAPGPVRLRRLAPGATYTLSWDTRELRTWHVPLQCGPDFEVNEVRGALAPVPDGSYPTRIAFERDLPPFCTQDGADPDLFVCDPTSDVPEGAPPISMLCETDGAAAALAHVGPQSSSTMVVITD